MQEEGEKITFRCEIDDGLFCTADQLIVDQEFFGFSKN
jgi:hypothetical protein